MTQKCLALGSLVGALWLSGCTDPSADPETGAASTREAVGIAELRCDSLEIGQPTITAVAHVNLQEGHVFHFMWSRYQDMSDAIPPTTSHDCGAWTPLSYPLNGRDEVWACQRAAGQPEHQVILGMERDTASYPFAPFVAEVRGYIVTSFASSTTAERVELVVDVDRVGCE